MTELFSFSNRTFYREDLPFSPLIGSGEGCNIVRIPLPARLEHDLDWKGAKDAAQAAILEGKFLFWEFDFGLETGLLELHDTARFLSFTLAIEQFLTRLLPAFKEHSFGVSLYKGDILFSNRFSWSEELENNCLESGLDERVYCAGIFVEYMHRLASYLPDVLLPFCLLDASALPDAIAAQILSKGRFFHLHLAVKGVAAPVGDLKWEGDLFCPFPHKEEVGVILPPDIRCTDPVIQKLEILLKQVLEQGQQPRIIPEALLNEHWDGLDRILAIEEALTQQGKRMLQGFAAAEGITTLV